LGGTNSEIFGAKDALVFVYTKTARRLDWGGGKEPDEPTGEGGVHL